MTTNETATVEEAVRWAARLASADCTAEERAAFEQWLTAVPAHADAYAAVLRVGRAVDRLAADARMQALTAQMMAMGDYDPDAEVARPQCRRRRIPLPWAAGIAASIVVAVVVAASVTSAPKPSVYTTVAGERRSVVLGDGSEVQLDVSSEILVRMTRSQRRVELVEGRALFEVAHDTLRPFSVKADDLVVTALGTRFQVQKQDERTVVTLAQGSIAVTAGVAHRSERLIPGEQLSLSVQGRAVKRQVDPDSETSWARGRHIFRETSLAEALVEINRYAARKVRLGDPALARLTVSGNFIAGDSEQIVKAIAAVLPLRVVGGGDGEIVLFGAHASGGANESPAAAGSG